MMTIERKTKVRVGAAQERLREGAYLLQLVALIDLLDNEPERTGFAKRQLQDFPLLQGQISPEAAVADLRNFFDTLASIAGLSRPDSQQTASGEPIDLLLEWVDRVEHQRVLVCQSANRAELSDNDARVRALDLALSRPGVLLEAIELLADELS